MNFALLDWDNTLRPGWTLLDWVSWLSTESLFDGCQQALIYEMEAQYQAGRVSYEKFAERLPRLYAAGLANRSVAAVDEAARSYAAKAESGEYAFVRPLLNLLEQASLTSVLVSGSPETVLVHLVANMPIAEVCATKAEQKDAKYTGRVSANRATKSGKERAAASYLARGGIELAVGDSSADTALFDVARTIIVVGDSDLVRAYQGAISMPTNQSYDEALHRLVLRLRETRVPQ